MSRVAIVTGGSSGIGRCTARELARRGWTVYELSRRDEPLEGVAHRTADLTDEESVRRAIREIVQDEGRVDLLVNNAGAGISGAIEFTGVPEAQRLFDLNVFGAARVNRAVIPLLRAQGSGRILHVSSVAAAAPLPFQAYYSASKAALTSYSLALANELRPFGVEVCAVQPGDIRSGFTAARQKLHEGDAAYDGRISRSVARMERDEQTGMPPERIARRLADLAEAKRLAPLVTTGALYRLAALLLRLLPPRPAQWLLYRLYGR